MRERGFLYCFLEAFSGREKKFSGGVFRESRHLWDAGTYLVDRVAEIGDYD